MVLWGSLLAQADSWLVLHEGLLRYNLGFIFNHHAIYHVFVNDMVSKLTSIFHVVNPVLPGFVDSLTVLEQGLNNSSELWFKKLVWLSMNCQDSSICWIDEIIYVLFSEFAWICGCLALQSAQRSLKYMWLLSLVCSGEPVVPTIKPLQSWGHIYREWHCILNLTMCK